MGFIMAGLSKSWVVLIDPKTQRPFWWNRRFRSRRDVRPAADDEGREGAGQGEPGTTCFIECFDLPSNRLFYVDLIHATTTWARVCCKYSGTVWALIRSQVCSL